MSTAQLILHLDKSGTIHAELPGINGARRKLDTEGITWPQEIIDALSAEQYRLDARDEAIERFEAKRQERIILAEEEKFKSEPQKPKIKPVSRAEIWDSAAQIANQDWVNAKIGPRKRGQKFEFEARRDSTRPWTTITTFDEVPTAWCDRVGWELKQNGKIRTPKSQPKTLSTSFGIQ